MTNNFSSPRAIARGKALHLSMVLGAGGSIMVALSATPAFAYLDPGSGSMFLQLLLGGLGGLAVALKLYWHRIRTTLGLGKSQPHEETASSLSSTEEAALPTEQSPQPPSSRSR